MNSFLGSPATGKQATNFSFALGHNRWIGQVGQGEEDWNVREEGREGRGPETRPVKDGLSMPGLCHALQEVRGHSKVMGPGISIRYSDSNCR